MTVSLLLYSPSRGARTFKPKKEMKESFLKTDDFIKKASATLGSGNLKQAVRLPEGQDLCEWVAVHSECSLTYSFPRVSLLYLLIFSVL